MRLGSDAPIQRAGRVMGASDASGGDIFFEEDGGMRRLNEVTIRPARPADAAAVNAALRALSETMGDDHPTTDADIARAAFGARAVCRALIAGRGEALVGVALYSPFYSTVRASAGAYVSDLWVDGAIRGRGLGARLLAAVRDAAARDWGAGLIRLAVYHDNARARAFYERLGFVEGTGETCLTLEGAALAALGEG